jgi:hypothetical protein
VALTHEARQTASAEAQVVVPLPVSFYSRLIAFFRALFPLLLATYVVAGTLDYAFTSSDASLRGRVLLGLLGLHAGMLAVALGWLMMRTAVARRPHLMVGNEGVTVRHKGMLRLPLVIPRERIRLVAVEAEPPRRQSRFRESKRFRLVSDSESNPQVPEWLYSRTGGSPFPLLSHVSDPPNVAFLFTEPTTIYQARRTTKVFPVKGPVHMVRQRQQTHGLLLRVRDSDLARRAFEQQGLLGSIGPREVEQVTPGVAQRDRARARSTRADLLAAAIVGLNVLGPVLAEGRFGPVQRSLLRDVGAIAWGCLGSCG